VVVKAGDSLSLSKKREELKSFERNILIRCVRNSFQVGVSVRTSVLQALPHSLLAALLVQAYCYILNEREGFDFLIVQFESLCSTIILLLDSCAR